MMAMLSFLSSPDPKAIESGLTGNGNMELAREGHAEVLAAGARWTTLLDCCDFKSVDKSRLTK